MTAQYAGSVVWLLSLLLLAVPAFSQTTGTAAAQPRSFRIGYVHADPESQLRGNVLYALREHLVSRPPVAAAMEEEGVAGMDVWASDSHQDLIQRMDQDDFDLVFCSSVDFVLQKGNYDAVLQLRHPEGRFDPGGRAVFHWGVIFVNNRSPLFAPDADAPNMAAYLQARPVAMVNSFSAAGYVYPMLRIASVTTGTATPAPLFCNSSEEVVKYVINGITEVGACEAGVIDKVLEANGLLAMKDSLVQVILETDPIPTDPVALHERWSPKQSALGREVRDALRQYFSRPDNKLPRLENSSRERYEDLRRNMEALREMR
jgi:ABC-type phosphate/phosphonate transport system substrate-binding protein